MKKPKIVCLCGSTKFKQEFIRANFIYTIAGVIVLSVGWFSHSDEEHTPTPEQKAMLDELHLRKIDLADEIMIIDVDVLMWMATLVKARAMRLSTQNLLASQFITGASCRRY